MMKRTDDWTPPTDGVAGLVARLVRLPMAFCVEMFVLTLQGLRRFTDEGIDAIGGAATALAGRGEDGSVSSTRGDPRDVASRPALNPNEPNHSNGNLPSNQQKEPSAMPDTNLNDDMLKLVRYKVLFVKREYEVAFPEQEELVFDNMTDTAFVAWKIAEFTQQLGETNMPPKWKTKNYPGNQTEKPRDPAIERKWQDERDRGGERRIYWLPEADKKYLRVYYEVLSRYAREKFKHEERQVEVLEQIRDSIRDKGAAAGAGGSKTTTRTP